MECTDKTSVAVAIELKKDGEEVVENGPPSVSATETPAAIVVLKQADEADGLEGVAEVTPESDEEGETSAAVVCSGESLGDLSTRFEFDVAPPSAVTGIKYIAVRVEPVPIDDLFVTFPNYVYDARFSLHWFRRFMSRGDPADARLDLKRIDTISTSFSGNNDILVEEANQELARFYGFDNVAVFRQGCSIPVPIPMTLFIVGRRPIDTAIGGGWSSDLHMGASETGPGSSLMNFAFRIVFHDKKLSITDTIWDTRSSDAFNPTLGYYLASYKKHLEEIEGEAAMWHFGLRNRDDDKFISTVDVNLGSIGVSQKQFAREPIGDNRFGRNAIDCGTSHKYVFYPDRKSSTKLYFTAIVMRLMFRSELPTSEGGTKEESKKRKIV